MNLEKLFQMQEELDHRIENQRDLASTSLLKKKVLALQVEIGELANETRCFKFWSSKEPSSKDKILEEYVDCLHFILSIGIEKGYEVQAISTICSNTEVSDQFLNLYVDINDLIICFSKDHYITLFEDFLTLGDSLGFTEEEIKEAYEQKNSVNHLRQENGY